MKALEDLSTQYDLTVRNSVGVMIQVLEVEVSQWIIYMMLYMLKTDNED